MTRKQAKAKGRRVNLQIFEASPKATPYSEIAPVKQEWLWPARIPYGQITLVAGHSDAAKSLFLADVIARVTKGMEWPDDAGPAPIGDALVFGEDPVDTVHAPRLIAAEANMQRVSRWSASFLLDHDMADLRSYLASHPNTRLVVFDPLQDYLTNAHNYRAVRATLLALCEVARKFGVAVAAAGHPTKDAANTEPIHAFGGSRGIPAAARQFWYVARQENDARLLLWVKSNLSDARTGLEFRPRSQLIKGSDGTEILTAKIEWNPAPVLMTAGEWYVQERAQLKAVDSKSAKAEALTFLRELLADGEEHTTNEVLEEAAAKGIKRGTLHEARRALKLDVRKSATKNGPWLWSWPDAQATGSTLNRTIQDHEPKIRTFNRRSNKGQS